MASWNQLTKLLWAEYFDYISFSLELYKCIFFTINIKKDSDLSKIFFNTSFLLGLWNSFFGCFLILEDCLFFFCGVPWKGKKWTEEECHFFDITTWLTSHMLCLWNKSHLLFSTVFFCFSSASGLHVIWRLSGFINDQIFIINLSSDRHESYNGIHKVPKLT